MNDQELALYKLCRLISFTVFAVDCKASIDEPNCERSVSFTGPNVSSSPAAVLPGVLADMLTSFRLWSSLVRAYALCGGLSIQGAERSEKKT